ncbi:hypothetical protein F5Y16DRAFT_406929 [Xylariaceae sp. FL0255]|nr:hypothetical protein F5Y16DRAFT_406929 [Xylariaceae sp. FL0255]
MSNRTLGGGVGRRSIRVPQIQLLREALAIVERQAIRENRGVITAIGAARAAFNSNISGGYSLEAARTAAINAGAAVGGVARRSRVRPRADEEDVLDEGENDDDPMDVDEDDANDASNGNDSSSANDDDSGGDFTTDNPDAETAQNRTTMGIELEFLMAVCSSRNDGSDPHPNDIRLNWDLYRNVANASNDPDNTALAYTIRNRVIQNLREQNIIANKTDEGENNFGIATSVMHGDGNNRHPDFYWWNSLEYEEDRTNDAIIGDWKGYYAMNPNDDEDIQVDQGTQYLVQQFKDYHANHGLNPHLTRFSVVDSLDILGMVVRPVGNDNNALAVETAVREEIKTWLLREKADFYSNQYPVTVDPLAVKVKGDGPCPYYAWTCANDITIEVPRSIPLDNVTNEVVNPFDFYHWWDPELVSPIYDFDNLQSFEELRKVCATLRNTFRIFKPHKDTGTGLHVHIGQEAGWTLLQAKRFSTLWLVLEKPLSLFHTIDRASNEQWVEPMEKSSGIGLWVHERSESYKKYQATTTGQRKAHYDAQLAAHVPLDKFPGPLLQEILQNIWQYRTLTELSKSFGGAEMLNSKGTIRIRLSGNKRSDPAIGFDTVEFRTSE